MSYPYRADPSPSDQYADCYICGERYWGEARGRYLVVHEVEVGLLRRPEVIEACYDCPPQEEG